MAYDLDGADLAEVQRRVVDPVVSALLAPDEVDAVRVQVGPPDDWLDRDPPDDAPYVWAVVTARGEVFEHVAAKLVFERDDAEGYAGYLFAALQDWICETSFGWGQWRDADLPPPPPPAVRAPLDGRRHLELYPEQDTDSPLWEGGANVPLQDLPLSDALTAALRQWRQRHAALVDDDAAWPGWSAVVAELEPERQRLVAALQEELRGGFVVATPIRLDRLTEQWLGARRSRRRLRGSSATP